MIRAQLGFRRSLWHCLVALAVAGVSLGFSNWPTVHAASISVTTLNDEYNTNLAQCSLREAIVAANIDSPFGGCSAGNGNDTIVLPEGTYVLDISGGEENSGATGDLDLASNIDIVGAGWVTSVISASNSLADRIFDVTGSFTVSISSVTITGGHTMSSGGGIANSTGTLTIQDSLVVQNEALIDGGGIWNSGALTIVDTTISANRGWFSGGGIRNTGSLVITNSTIANNTSSGGGGLSNWIGSVTITNSTFSGNSANMGGGIDNLQPGTIEMLNTTLYSNTAFLDGGGIRSEIAGPAHLKNTILAGNIDALGSDFPDCIGAIFSRGHNVVGVGGCFMVATGDQAGTLGDPLDPRLGPLQDNGGATYTHSLLENSPAIDFGANSGCPLMDQRGIARPQGSNCDVGAYEYNPAHIIFLPLIIKTHQ